MVNINNISAKCGVGQGPTRKTLVLIDENGLCVTVGSGKPCDLSQAIETGSVWDAGFSVGDKRAVFVEEQSSVVSVGI